MRAPARWSGTGGPGTLVTMRLETRVDPTTRASVSTTAPPAQFAASATTVPPVASPPRLSSSRDRVNALEPATGVGLRDRKRHEPERHAIARRAELLRTAHAHRHEHPQRLGRHRVSGFPQGGAQRAAHHGEDDVVDRATQAVRHPLHRREVDGRPGHVTVRPDGTVEANGWRRGQLVLTRRQRLPAAAPTRPAASRGPRSHRPTARPASAAPCARRATSSRRSVGGGRRRARPPGLGLRDHSIHIEIEQRREHPDAGDAVDDAVMHLRHEREPPSREAVDHPGLPQRPPAIERTLQDLGAPRPELLDRARLGKAREPQMARQVEAVVVDPHGVAHQGQVVELLAKPRNPLDTRFEVAPDAIDVDPAAGPRQRARLEDGRDRHVHVGVARLEPEEAGVEPGQSFVVRHPTRHACCEQRSCRPLHGALGAWHVPDARKMGIAVLASRA